LYTLDKYTCLLIDSLIYLINFNLLMLRSYFEKEHELERGRLEKNEVREHKVRSLSLKQKSKIMIVSKKKNINPLNSF